MKLNWLGLKNTMKYHSDRFIYSDIRKSNTKKIVATIVAILLAIFIALFIAMAIYNDGAIFGKVFDDIFTTPFSTASKTNNTLTDFAIFGVAGLSFIFAYKAGLFNIGISGQMLFGAILASIAGHAMGNNVPNGLGQIIMILIGMIGGGIIGALIGILKAYLNTNEVVSSIMFNWIIYYIGTYIISQSINADSGGVNTEQLPQNVVLRIGSESWIPLLIIFVVILAICFVSLKYMVFGKKIVNTGLSQTGAKYAGYSVKKNQISAMLISGIIAGILGIMVYAGRETSLPFTSAAKAIPQDGFNGISVGLIAMSNPIAVVPISLFFGAVSTAKVSIGAYVDNSIVDLIFGIIVYGSAIMVAIMWFKPYLWLIRLFKGKEGLKKYKNKINQMQVVLEQTNNELYSIKKHKDSKALTWMKKHILSHVVNWHNWMHDHVYYYIGFACYQSYWFLRQHLSMLWYNIKKFVYEKIIYHINKSVLKKSDLSPNYEIKYIHPSPRSSIDLYDFNLDTIRSYVVGDFANSSKKTRHEILNNYFKTKQKIIPKKAWLSLKRGK